MAEKTTPEESPPVEAPFEPSLLPDEELREIADGSRALQQALDGNPELMAEVETLLRECTQRGITRDSAQLITNGLRLFDQPEGLQHLWTLLLRSDDYDYVETVKDHSTPSTWNWLRRLLALYGADIREAHLLAGCNEEDWRTINRRAYYEAVSGDWAVFLEIIKFNGQRISLNATPFSALYMAQGILNTLATVPAEAALNLIDQKTVQDFANLAVDVVALYAPGLLKELGQKVRGATAEAARRAKRQKD